MVKLYLMLISSFLFCTGFFGFFDGDKIEPEKIICSYTAINPTPSNGISEQLEGYSTGNSVVDGFNTVIGFLDDLQGLNTIHSYTCYYKDNKNKLSTQVNKGLLRYIVFYNGMVSKYYKIYTSSLYDNTLKSTIDFLGLIDKEGNIIHLDAVSGENLRSVNENDLKKLSKYKFEQ